MAKETAIIEVLLKDGTYAIVETIEKPDNATWNWGIVTPESLVRSKIRLRFERTND